MNQNLFPLLFYAQIAIGIAAVTSTGSTSLVTALLSLAAIPAGWLLDKRQKIILPVRFARPVFGLLVIFLVAAVFLFRLGWFYAILELLLLLAAIKLISPKANRDYLQIIAIGFLLILISSILTTDAIFSFYFLAYVFFLCWTLMVFTVKVVLERDLNPVRSAVATRQAHLPPEQAEALLDKRLFVSSAVVITIVMLFTVLFFMFFPRFGAGLVGGTLGLQGRTSGLSNTIDFDHFGAIKPDTTIVARILVEEGKLRLPTYLRGRTLESFDGQQWQNRQNRRQLPTGNGGTVVLRTPASSSPELRYRLLADDLGVQMMPLLPGTWWLQFKSRALLGRDDGTVERTPYFRGAFGYTAKTVPGGYLWAQNLALEMSRSDAELDSQSADILYRRAPPPEALQFPASASPAVALLMHQSGSTNDPHPDWRAELQWGLNLVGFLQTNYSYTLELPLGEDRLLAFVERRAGHCEFFATLFALALRSRGIPSRLATGFYGGEDAMFGDYTAFRNSDAHSWVEAWLPPFGWVAFDPTPALRRPPPSWIRQVWDTSRNLADLYQLWWINRIVNYDLGSQKEVLESIQSSWSRGQSSGLPALVKKLPRTLRWLFIGLIVVCSGLALWLFIRPGVPSKERRAPAYSKVLRADGRRLKRIQSTLGRSRAASESWEEFCLHTRADRILSEEDWVWLRRYLQRRYGYANRD